MTHLTKVYIAWRDSHDCDSEPEIIGVFATEDLAKALCGSKSETYYREHEVESTARPQSWRDIYVCRMDKNLRRNSGGNYTYSKLMYPHDEFHEVADDESWVVAESSDSADDAKRLCEKAFSLAKERGEVYARPLPDGVSQFKVTKDSIINDGVDGLLNHVFKDQG